MSDVSKALKKVGVPEISLFAIMLRGGPNGVEVAKIVEAVAIQKGVDVLADIFKKMGKTALAVVTLAVAKANGQTALDADTDPM